jgi:Zn/Cd-binding protein ZinT
MAITAKRIRNWEGENGSKGPAMTGVALAGGLRPRSRGEAAIAAAVAAGTKEEERIRPNGKKRTKENRTVGYLRGANGHHRSLTSSEGSWESIYPQRLFQNLLQ